MFTNDFISLCRDYAIQKSNVLFHEFEDTKKLCTYSIEFYNYILEFRYIKKASTFVKPSSLYCVLKLRKSSVVHYHLTEIIPFLEEKSFNSCYFWHIESSERLKHCFESLTSTLEIILSQIEPFLANDTILKNALFESYVQLYNLKPESINFDNIDNPAYYDHNFFLRLQNMHDGYIFSRYSNFEPYKLLLQNKPEKALLKYEKLRQKNKLTEYEKSLISHVVNLNGCEFRPFSPLCDTSSANKLLTLTSSIKAFLSCFFISSVLFCGFTATYNFIASINSLILLSAPWYVGFLCAALCSIFGAMAFITYIPNKHLNKTQRKNFSNILIDKPTKILTFAGFAVFFIASMALTIIMMVSNVRFCEDNIKFPGEAYNYTEIQGVYHVEARYNIYDERIDRSSYVILFDDNTTLDLDGYTSIEFTEKEVVPFLKDKGFDIIYVDSEKDIINQ